MKRGMGLLAGLVLAVGCDNCNDGLQNLTPKGELDPAIYSFGVVRVGATCPASLTLINRGGQEMHISGNSFRNDNSAGAFQVIDLPTLVETAGEAPVNLQYAPTVESNGIHSATLVVSTDSPDNGGQVTALIQGEATNQLAGKILPRCKVNSTDAEETAPCTTMDFGSTPKDSDTGISRSITITNDGTAPFNILQVNVQPVGGATVQPEFTLDLINDQAPSFPVVVNPSREGDCGTPVMGQQGAKITVVFRPTRVGVQAARIQIITDAFTTGTGEGATIGQSNINVSGVGSGVGLGITPEFVPFGSVPAGMSDEKTVRVANLDINPASVNTSCIDMDGDGDCVSEGDVDCTGGDADVSTGLNCDVVGQGKGFVLQATDAMAGGSDEVEMKVTWTPPAAVSFSKDLLLKTNIAGNRVYVVRLTGGTAGTIASDTGGSLFLPASTDTAGATGMATFTLSNTGMADLVINRIEFEGANSITDDFTLTGSGASSSVNMSCTRAANQMFCMVPPFSGAITLAPNAQTTLTLSYADNDVAVAIDTFDILISHNGNGGNPFTITVDVCKPAGGMSNRPTCP